MKKQAGGAGRGVGEPPALEVRLASPAVAQAQAAWIVRLEPWLGLGYRAAPLGRYLARMARGHQVWVVPGAGPKGRGAARRHTVAGVVVATDGFLLGGFVGLLAVRPEAAGRGVGTALMGHVARQVFDRRRWLFVSCDADNHAALRFYRRLGFTRVGRLPDLVAAGRTEWLLRKARPE